VGWGLEVGAGTGRHDQVLSSQLALVTLYRLGDISLLCRGLRFGTYFENKLASPRLRLDGREMMAPRLTEYSSYTLNTPCNLPSKTADRSAPEDSFSIGLGLRNRQTRLDYRRIAHIVVSPGERHAESGRSAIRAVGTLTASLPHFIKRIRQGCIGHSTNLRDRNALRLFRLLCFLGNEASYD